MSGTAGVNPVALAKAAAELGMSLADLPPPPGAFTRRAGGVSLQNDQQQQQQQLSLAMAFTNRPPSPSAKLPPLERPPSSNGRSPQTTSSGYNNQVTSLSLSPATITITRVLNS